MDRIPKKNRNIESSKTNVLSRLGGVERCNLTSSCLSGNSSHNHSHYDIFIFNTIYTHYYNSSNSLPDRHKIFQIFSCNEASRGAVARVTVKSTDCGFDPYSRR